MESVVYVTSANPTPYESGAKKITQVKAMYLTLNNDMSVKFPGLRAKMIYLRGLVIRNQSQELETFKARVFVDASKTWNLDDLKNNPVFRAYRDFFWKVKVDPTKIRPASEALLRRILRGNPLPTINTLVDAYNLASVKTNIPFGAFDTDKVRGNLMMREAKIGEEFLGIGMDKPIKLTGGEAVIQDDDRLVAVYPYRDADYSKVTITTRNLLLLTCGVPGISDEMLEKAEAIGVEYINLYCGGSTT
jgi:DNA/RNA-binding domain of Phe-tRNA-synthetase-like protein